MQLNVPVYHQVKGRQKGHRTVYTHSVYTLSEFDFAYVPSEDAPVALTYYDRNNEYVVELRFHDGRFWRPEMSLGQRLEPETWAGMLPEAGKRSKDADRDPPGWTRLAKSQDRQMNCSELTADSYRDVTESDFQSKRAELAARLEKSARIIDGNVWFEVPEPRYFLSKDTNKVLSRVVFGNPRKKSAYGTPLAEDGEFFRIDRYEDMAAHEAENFEDRESRLGPEATILIPGIYEFRDEEASLQGKCEKICAGLRSWLSELPTSVGTAWFNLRDAAKEAKDGKEASAYERLGESLATLSEAIETSGSVDSLFCRQAAADAKATLSRWHLRTMDLQQGFSL